MCRALCAHHAQVSATSRPRGSRYSHCHPVSPPQAASACRYPSGSSVSRPVQWPPSATRCSPPSLGSSTTKIPSPPLGCVSKRPPRVRAASGSSTSWRSRTPPVGAGLFREPSRVCDGECLRVEPCSVAAGGPRGILPRHEHDVAAAAPLRREHAVGLVPARLGDDAAIGQPPRPHDDLSADDARRHQAIAAPHAASVVSGAVVPRRDDAPLVDVHHLGSRGRRSRDPGARGVQGGRLDAAAPHANSGTQGRPITHCEVVWIAQRTSPFQHRGAPLRRRRGRGSVVSRPAQSEGVFDVLSVRLSRRWTASVAPTRCTLDHGQPPVRA